MAAAPRLRTREELIDDLGRDWLFETEISNGFASVYVTAPGEERRQLTTRRAVSSTRPHRPSVDSEEPLPLDFS